MNWKWGVAFIIWLGLTALFALSLLPTPMPDRASGFSSEEELNDWLAKDKTDSGFRLYDKPCYDAAEYLVSRAELQGYRFYLEILNDDEYKYYYGSDKTPVNPQGWPQNGNYHAVVSVKIGENIYLIEPRTDEVWFYTELIRSQIYD